MVRQTLLLICLILPYAQVSASNLLQDPGFAAGIDPPWAATQSPSGVSWETTDEAGAGDSGSLLFVDAGEFGALVSQCVDISAAAVSRAGYSYLIPADVSPVFFAPRLFIRYYDQPLCDGDLVDSDDVNPPTPFVQGEWTRFETPVAIQPGVVSASFAVYFAASGSSNNRAFVDNALFGDPPLFTDRFEATSLP
jgi:hypothetical protein